MTSIGDIVRRLLGAGAAMLAASLVLFLLLMVGPDPLAQLQQEGEVDTSQLARQYGWDDPWPVQYGRWLGGIVQGDWGDSIRTGEPAAAMITERLPLTLLLAGSSSALAALAAILVGAWTARRRDTRRDRWTTGTMVAVGAMPSFLIALLLQWCAVQYKDATGSTLVYVGGMPRDGGLIELAQRLALPILVLTLMQFAAWMRFQRSELIGALEDDVVVAARARGIPERDLLRRHAMRRTLAPLLTLIALELGTLVGGTLVVETVFSLPGLGRLLLDSVQGRDIVVALDIVVLGAVAIIVATTIADIVIARIDPRVGVA